MLDALAAVTKAILYAGILTGAGAALVEVSWGRSQRAAGFLTQLVRRGALLTILAASGNTVILFLRLSGQLDEATLSAVFSSGAGAATALQLAGAFLLLVSSGEDPFARGTRVSEAALLVFSLAISGHAAMMGFVQAAVAFVHLAAVAWWVGSLWLLRHICDEAPPPDVGRAVRAFSALAVKIVFGLIAAGVVLVIALYDFSATPVITPYLQILALKICVAAVALGLATYNRFRLTPRLGRLETSAALTLRRMISAELLVIGAIFVVTAILTTYTWPNREIPDHDPFSDFRAGRDASSVPAAYSVRPNSRTQTIIYCAIRQ